jgi:hypothetical protein
MTNLLLYFVAIATVITSVVNFLKPAYKKFAGRFNATISIAVSFILWVLASFSVAPYLGLELNTGLLILLGLALWTGSNIFYDLWNIVKGIWERLNNLSKKE